MKKEDDMSGYFVPKDYAWDCNAPVAEWPHELLADLTGMLRLIAREGSSAQKTTLLGFSNTLHEAITGARSPARILPRQAKPRRRRGTDAGAEGVGEPSAIAQWRGWRARPPSQMDPAE